MLLKRLSLSVEVFETEYKKMLKEAKELSEILKKYQDIIKIKIPVTKDGLAVIKQLKELDIKTTLRRAILNSNYV